jgi:hypothetical protein
MIYKTFQIILIIEMHYKQLDKIIKFNILNRNKLMIKSLNMCL